MMHTRSLIPTTLRFLFLCTGAWALSGCSMAAKESFTFQAEMPENFTANTTSFYGSAFGETCSGHKTITSGEFKGGQIAELTLPLTDSDRGCPVVLKNVLLNIEGKWGTRELDMSLQKAGLTIRDEPSESSISFPSTGPLVFQSQCQWLFRTAGPDRYIIKILKCRALDSNGNVQKKLAGGALQRGQLAGKTVKFVLTEADEEKPYFDRYWIKTIHGWKPCKGNWGRDIEELCVTPPQFKPFKMPDGRDCTVYPNCTE